MACRFACLGVRQIAQSARPFSPATRSSNVGVCDPKLAPNYLAFIKLASIRIWLRANESAAQSDHDVISLFEHDRRANA
jgi:hypothetical protein